MLPSRRTPVCVCVCVCVCVWVCDFSPSVCQCKISLPRINAKRVVPVATHRFTLPTVLSLPSPPILPPTEWRTEASWKQMEGGVVPPPLRASPLLSSSFSSSSSSSSCSFPPPLRPLSKWSTPSCPLLRSGLPLRWWWPCRRRGHRPSPWPRGSDTFLWRERENRQRGGERRCKIAEAVKAKHWDCKMAKGQKDGVARCSNMKSRLSLQVLLLLFFFSFFFFFYSAVKFSSGCRDARRHKVLRRADKRVFFFIGTIRDFLWRGFMRMCL